jgi:hypothetical protein
LIALDELELLRGLCSVASRMVCYHCLICVLLAVGVGEGGKQLSDGFYLWKMFVDFSVFEEVIEDN